MKPVKTVKAHFADNPNIAFLYISIDQETARAKWLAAIQKHEITGMHVLAGGGFADPVAKRYDVSSIPAYFIIDRQGNFFAINPPRPSQQDGQPLIDLLEKALGSTR
jgi:alkyl hydroperoxide reductase subunit AhpC